MPSSIFDPGVQMMVTILTSRLRCVEDPIIKLAVHFKFYLKGGGLTETLPPRGKSFPEAPTWPAPNLRLQRSLEKKKTAE